MSSDAFVPVYERDLVLVSGKGAKLTDSEGKTYLDFAAGIAVNGLGHADRKVVQAIRKQAGLLIHASNLYHTQPALELARHLAGAAFPARVFFSNSGTEAIEAAIKFSRKIGKAQGRTELVAFERAFHGRTLGALSLTWTPKYREPFEPLVPGARFCAFNDLAAAEQAIGAQTAAVFLEPIQGEGGIRNATPEFAQGLARLCRERGALLVADEIQCGLGRTGKLFAHQHLGITPDMVILAKPLGGGLPLGAVLLREELAAAMKVGDHGSTFGGNPVACAAGVAVWERLNSEGFLEGVMKRGDTLRRGLLKLGRAYPKQVKQVRGMGLMVGVELAGPAGPLVKALRGRGVLVTKSGENVIRLLPPLVVGNKEIRSLLSELEGVLKEGLGAAEPVAEPAATAV